MSGRGIVALALVFLAWTVLVLAVTGSASLVQGRIRHGTIAR